ncbi:unnamed protein product [Ceratitis capitata]|uniref:(Mediterranean fruit fly) hypothetical protein n=1 Tax=Ceratitis capitata TaxID=7213 RepID=A0A811UQ70_CERCA|nr:unnamed protein product [Ceratitis capitata]
MKNNNVHPTLQMTIILMLFAMSSTKLIIEDINSPNGFAEIALEDVDITYSYNTILHIIDPKEIQHVIEGLEENTRIISNTNDKHFLNLELEKKQKQNFKLASRLDTRED